MCGGGESVESGGREDTGCVTGRMERGGSWL